MRRCAEERFVKNPVYVGNDRVLLKTPAGLKMFVDSSDVSIAPHLILDGEWEIHVERALKRVVKRGMNVIEVGANLGFFTLLFALHVGEEGSVRSFEPDRRLATIVRDNISMNAMHRIARVEELAVSDATGTATFYAADRHRSAGSLLSDVDQIPWNATDTRSRIEVQTITLDEYVAREGFAPDLIKIDAEGAESAVLRGAHGLLNASRPLTLILEFIPKFITKSGDDPGEFLARLSERGFTIELINDRNRRIEQIDRDGLLARPYSELLATR